MFMSVCTVRFVTYRCICCGSENVGLESLHGDSVRLAGPTPQFRSVALYMFDYRFVAE
jgi:hypothetical protein